MTYTDVQDMAAKIMGRCSGPIMGWWAAASALEAICIGLLTADVTAAQPAPGLGVFEMWRVFAGASGVELVLAAAIVAAGLFRTALYRPMRDAVVDDVHRSRREVFRMALSRMLPVFAASQVVGLFVVLAAAVSLLLGLLFPLFPQLIVSFTLAPTVYFVAAREERLSQAIGSALTATHRFWVFTFGVQCLLTTLAVLLNSWFQSYAGFAGGHGVVFSLFFVFLFFAYRFAEWISLSAVYLSVDEHL